MNDALLQLLERNSELVSRGHPASPTFQATYVTRENVNKSEPELLKHVGGEDTS